MPIIFFSFFSMKSFFFPAKLRGLLSAEISRGRICWNWWRIEDWYDGSDWFPPDLLNKSQGIKELRGCQQLWKYLQALAPCVLMVAQVRWGWWGYFFFCGFLMLVKKPMEFIAETFVYLAFVSLVWFVVCGVFLRKFHVFSKSESSESNKTWRLETSNEPWNEAEGVELDVIFHGPAVFSRNL